MLMRGLRRSKDLWGGLLLAAFLLRGFLPIVFGAQLVSDPAAIHGGEHGPSMVVICTTYGVRLVPLPGHIGAGETDKAVPEKAKHQKSECLFCQQIAQSFNAHSGVTLPMPRHRSEAVALAFQGEEAPDFTFRTRLSPRAPPADRQA